MIAKGKVQRGGPVQIRTAAGTMIGGYAVQCEDGGLAYLDAMMAAAEAGEAVDWAGVLSVIDSERQRAKVFS
jgi:hypothetical protein